MFFLLVYLPFALRCFGCVCCCVFCIFATCLCALLPRAHLHFILHTRTVSLIYIWCIHRCRGYSSWTPFCRICAHTAHARWRVYLRARAFGGKDIFIPCFVDLTLCLALCGVLLLVDIYLALPVVPCHCLCPLPCCLVIYLPLLVYFIAFTHIWFVHCPLLFLQNTHTHAFCTLPHTP